METKHKVCRTQEEFNNYLKVKAVSNETIVFDEAQILPKELTKSTYSLLLKKYFDNKKKILEEELRRNTPFMRNK